VKLAHTFHGSGHSKIPIFMRTLWTAPNSSTATYSVFETMKKKVNSIRKLTKTKFISYNAKGD
jgi:gas vesicle protein